MLFRSIGSAAVVIDNKIIFGSYDAYVYCIDTSGKLVWKYNIGSEVTLAGYLPAAHKNTIFFNDANMRINAININGSLKWQYRRCGHEFLAVFGNMLYASAPNGELT